MSHATDNLFSACLTFLDMLRRWSSRRQNLSGKDTLSSEREQDSEGCEDLHGEVDVLGRTDMMQIDRDSWSAF